jgi:hypothetical protein
MRTIKLTEGELEAVNWAVSQFAGGDAADNGGSKTRLRDMCAAANKLPASRLRIRRDEGGTPPARQFWRD